MKSKGVGALGEDVTDFWLKCQGYRILHRGWRSRWGEIDIIAYHDNFLIFIEVKTRKKYNWDHGGLLAVNDSKQNKLRLTAEIFLSVNPQYQDVSCRFDIVCLRYYLSSENPDQEQFKLLNDSCIIYDKYKFEVAFYLKNAF
ncbi:MAG: YraN family protein [Cyanobacterium sp. T60_A2020_053]|nr:YraN family protein [Cyanobacterium sp. T60_A2020_053]